MQKTYRTGEETLLRAYLPATLVEQWALRPEQHPLWGVWLKGSLMFCDVSGFTAMSEKLAQVGREGAELMASVLNRFFERMLAIADGWGGAQMKFGGDAMLLHFSGDGHADRAAAAGQQRRIRLIPALFGGTVDESLGVGEGNREPDAAVDSQYKPMLTAACNSARGKEEYGAIQLLR